MSRFYAPQGSKINPKPATAGEPPACALIRFVLKSGAALELREDSIDEVVGTWADQMCKAVCGCKGDGTKAVIPVNSVDYMEEVQ